MTGVVKPQKPAPAPKTKGRKPPAGKLTAKVCDTCERDMLVGYASGVVVRLEASLTTTAAEPPLWALGQPTYAVHRTDAGVNLELRIPSVAPVWVEEVAIAHICDASARWMPRVLRCPQWFGHSRYVVAQFGPSVRVMRADDLADVYKEVLTCSTIEMAQDTVQRLNWRDRARLLQ